MVRFFLVAALLGTAGTSGTVHAGDNPASYALDSGRSPSQAPPFYCQWIPPDFSPDECRTSTPSDSDGDPGLPIESAFASAGSWAVNRRSVADASGQYYTLFYPTDLGANGFRHPILTWGNGTGSTPDDYADTLNHLASWGFVVVASNSAETGWGGEMLGGVKYMLGQARQASSIFFEKLDTAKVGALGHSQGATGALNATASSKGLISSAMAISLPDPFWFFLNRAQMPDFRRLNVPVFFITGTRDFLATSQAQQNYYNQVPGPAGKAALVGGGHNSIQDADNDLLGYVTAWMMYTLQGDSNARAAFAGDRAEINANPSWQNQIEKNLP